MKDADAELLRKFCRGRKPAEVKAVFALVRASTDRKLLAALKPPKKKPVRRGDPLVKDVEHAFRPLMATSAEKADLLVEHMLKAHKKRIDLEAKGLADAVKRLRRHFNDDQIRAGAENQVRKLSALYGKRETVV